MLKNRKTKQGSILIPISILAGMIVIGGGAFDVISPAGQQFATVGPPLQTIVHTLMNTITVIDTSPTLFNGIAVTMGSDGLPLIVYETTGPTIMAVKCGNPTCSSGNVFTPLKQENIDTMEVETGSDGLPIISYIPHTRISVNVIKCGNLDCSSGNSESVLDFDSTSGFQTAEDSLAIGSDGYPVIAYQQGKDASFPGNPRQSRIKFIKCGNLDCSSGNSIEVIDEILNDTSGLFPLIAPDMSIGSDGFPVISYLEFESGGYFLPDDIFALKVAKCNDLACSSNTVYSYIDSAELAGTSITTGADGLPIISYTDLISGGPFSWRYRLRVAKCENIDCSLSKFTIYDGDYWSNSITIRNNGLPIVVISDKLLDPSKKDIAILDCHNQDCSSGTIITPIDDGEISFSGDPVAFDNNGLPIIVYNVFLDGILKALKCGTPSCK